MSQADTRTSIESLHARAEASYRSGDFEDARAAWNEILSLDPSDERAREGLQLLSLVDPKWAVFEEAEQEGGAGPAAEIEEVRALLRAGHLPEARQRLENLAASIPGDEAVAALSRELAAAEALRADVDARLAAARQALEAGDAAAAMAACREVLATVPGDRAAERLLEEAEAALAARPAAGAPVPGGPAPDLPLDLELDLDAVAPGPAPAGASPRPGGRAPASPGEMPAVPGTAPGGHLELDAPDDLPVIPLGSPSPGEPPAPANVGGASPASSPPQAATPGPAAAEGVPSAAAEEVLEDLFEAARELEEQGPVEGLAAPGAELPEEPPAAPAGNAALLVARAREELERGNTAEATQLAARALALDATLAEAERVLEEARKRDEEKARQAEDLVGQAVRALDDGQPHLAIPLLRQVLELIPEHAEARDLLARAEAAESVLPAAAEVPAAANAAPPPVAPPPRPETHDLPPVGEIPPAPAPPGEAAGSAAPPAPVTPSPPKRRSRRRSSFALPRKGILAAVLALVVVGGGGVAAWQLGFLPPGPGDGQEEAPPAPVRHRPRKARQDAAERPASRGNAGSAGEAAQGTVAAATDVAKRGQEPRYTKRDVPRLVRQAEQALRRGDEAKAVELLEVARKADPLDFDLVEKLEAARMRLKERRDAEARLARAKRAFRDGDWPEALRIFYRIPGPYRPPQIDRWIADGWYNLGVQALQAGDVVEARRYFGDCLELAPDDEMARRHREVALRYRGEPLDDAYWMYVRALEPRPLRE